MNKRKLFTLAKAALEVTTVEFAKTVKTDKGIGVLPQTIDQYLQGRLPSKNIEKAIDEFIEKGITEIKIVIDEYEKASS